MQLFLVPSNLMKHSLEDFNKIQTKSLITHFDKPVKENTCRGRCRIVRGVLIRSPLIRHGENAGLIRLKYPYQCISGSLDQNTPLSSLANYIMIDLSMQVLG